MYKKIKTLIYPIAKLAFDTYNLKKRNFTFKDITVSLDANVFPPKFTISTKLLLNYLEKLNLDNKTVLELGCGSGIIALFAAKKGAKTIASDINLVAISNLKKAALKNNLEVTVLTSDLFTNIPQKSFDYIFINPPYYPKNPKNTKEQAWFCGENFEYFEALFTQLKHIACKNCIMILSEDCDLVTIKKIASKNNLNLKLIEKHRILKEENYIFNIAK